MSPPTKTPTGTAMKLHRIMDLFVEQMDREAPIAQMMAFLMIAEAGQEGLAQSDLQKQLKVSKAAASRTVAVLANLHYSKDKPGFQLVEKREDPVNNSRNILRLTAEGQKLVDRISQELK